MKNNQINNAFKLALMLAVSASTEKKSQIALSMAEDLQQKINASTQQRIKAQIDKLIPHEKLFNWVLNDLMKNLNQ
tara:strand:- start:312 stop:539 length:228 start_codon:yes stop_codon:yes gene_type:complete